MGQFSWLDCITNKPILDGVSRTSYVLVPQEFGGGHIAESRYDGYGHFGGNDIYDLVLDWNRDYIPEYIELIQAGNWECNTSTRDIQNLQDYYEGNPITCEERWLGIILACYNEDNERLRYPIKITYDANAVYEKCRPSLSDPNQGWGSSEPVGMVFIISCDELQGKALNKSSVRSLVNKIFKGEVDGNPEMIINNTAEMQEWYGEDDEYENEFEVRVHAMILDEDNAEYLVDRIYTEFENAGYYVLDIYWDYD